MRLPLPLLLASIFLPALALPIFAIDAPPPMPAPNHVKIFLLIGQSNMAGRGPIEAEDKTPHPRVLMLNKAENWALAISPLHFDKPQVAGVGPGLTFGKTIAEAMPQDTIGLVPCAVGGTSIDQWKKGGTLYDNAVQRAQIAMKDGELAGILWHQGESDQGKSAVYAPKAQRLFADLRQDLNAPAVPIVVGTLGDWREDHKAINDVLRKLPASVPHCGVADAAGLTHKGDHLHFSTASARELGKRYAAEWLKLEKTVKPTNAAKPTNAGGAVK